MPISLLRVNPKVLISLNICRILPLVRPLVGYWGGCLLGGVQAPATLTTRGGRVRLLRLGLLAALLAVTPGVTSGLAQSPSAVEQARAAVIRQSDLQLQLPSGAEDEPPSSSGRGIRIPEWAFWVVVTAGVLFILYHLRDVLPGLAAWGRTDRGWTEEAEEGAPLATRSPADVLLTADELARAGRYVDAMHVLLLKSLTDIRQRLDEEFADSLTSREILRRARLPAAGATALGEIVLGVERSYFGDHPVGLEDYRACRRHFDELGAALIARAPA